MNPLVAFAVTGVLFAVFIASLAVRLSRAPGWAHLRGLAAIALACGAISSARAGEYLLAGSPHVILAVRLELASIGACLVSWLAYSRAYLGLSAARGERAFSAIVVAAASAALVPDLVYPDHVVLRTLPPGLEFSDPEATPLAALVYALYAVGAAALVARFAHAARRGTRGAPWHLLGVLLAALPIAWDAAVAVTGAQLPYVTDPGLFFSLGIVPLALAETFRADADTQRTDRTGLEALVAERTTALSDRRRDLASSEQLASVGRLAAGVSHEVNSPLAAARANVDWLLEASADEQVDQDEVVAALDDATRAIDRVRRIVKQLAHLTGASAAPGRIQRVPIDPALQQAARLAAALRGARVPIRCDPAPAGLAASADEGALVQVVVNLLVNAIDAVDEASGSEAVVVRAARDGDRAIVTVEDRGAGMSEETLARVFEPFFTTKAVGRGTGLGLAVSRALVAAAGGALRVTSRLGEGTRVTLDLPAAPAAPETAESAATAAPERRRRILLVDDEPSVRAALRRLLSRYHDLAVADGVDDALAALAREDFDLVLCDVVMPDGGGERLYREASARAAAVGERFVFVTGGAPDEATRRFLASQPQPVIEKPVDLASLEAAALAIAPVSPSRGARARNA